MITFVSVVGFFSATMSFIGFITDAVVLTDYGWDLSVFFECIINLFTFIYTICITILLIRFNNTNEKHDKEIAELKKSVRELKQRLGITLSSYDSDADDDENPWNENDGNWIQDEEGKWHYRDDNDKNYEEE